MTYCDRHDIFSFLALNDPVVAVVVQSSLGSTPRNEGCWMLVSDKQSFRTIGGGHLEYMAIDQARNMLARGQKRETVSIPLGPEIGQCCGGRVGLEFEQLDNAGVAKFAAMVNDELNTLPKVFIFGAGHVGHCLAQALSLMPVNPVLVDSRQDELEAAPVGVETYLTPMPEEIVRTAPAGSGFVILTHDHALDFLITREALDRSDARYVGLIGSNTKKTTFQRWYAGEGDDEANLEKLVCPIGKTTSKDKRPELIACFVAAEIMEHLSGSTMLRTDQPGDYSQREPT